MKRKELLKLAHLISDLDDDLTTFVGYKEAGDKEIAALQKELVRVVDEYNQRDKEELARLEKYDKITGRLFDYIDDLIDDYHSLRSRIARGQIFDVICMLQTIRGVNEVEKQYFQDRLNNKAERGESWSGS